MTDLRSELTFGMVLAGISAAGSAMDWWVVAGLAALGALPLLGHAYYEGTTLLLLSPRWGGLPGLAQGVVLGPWLVIAWMFSRDATLGAVKLNGEAAWAAGAAALFVGWLARAITQQVDPRPTRIRAHLVGLAVVTFLCALGGSGYAPVGSEEDGAELDVEVTPQQRHDRAFFNYVLYSCACAVGIASARRP